MIHDEVIRNDWHAVYRSDHLHDGDVRKVRLLGEDLVIWRWQGRVMAWMDLCIHRGARLSMGWIENGEIVCPYHGWRYNCEGRCTLMPAHPDQPPPEKARTFAYHVQERYGLVWVCMGQPAADVPPLPEWGQDGFVSVHTGPYHIKCNGMRGVENVLDVTHTPYVHAALLGDASAAALDDYDAFVADDGVRTGEMRVYQPAGDHRRIPTQSRYRFWANRPLTGYLIKFVGNTECFSHYMTFSPLEDAETNLFVITSTNFDTDGAEQRINDRNDEVFNQDKPILEGQRPQMLPLDPRMETHNRADKLSVVYRKWARDLGVSDAV